MPLIRILDNLYVFALPSLDENAKKNFMKLDDLDKIELLLSKEPRAKRIKHPGLNYAFYTVAFGEFCVSPSPNYHIASQNEKSVKQIAEILFCDLKKSYAEMNDLVSNTLLKNP
jgi:hypothetical protein